MAVKILLTGDSDIGKTTILKDVLKNFTNKFGFWTERVEIDGKRVAFDIVTHQNIRLNLANIKDETSSRVGKYYVQTQNLDHIIRSLTQIPPETLLYIDEIGQMELEAPSFSSLVQNFLSAPNPLIGVITKNYQHPFVAEIKSNPLVKIIEVTEENRDSLTPLPISQLS